MYYDNKVLVLNIVYIIAGVVLIVLSVTEVLGNPVYSGMGGALMAIGALRLHRTIKYRKDEGYREKIDTAVSDERSSFLRMKSWAWTGYIVILVEGIGSIVALVMGERTIQLILAYSVGLILAVFCVVYLILGKKY